MLNEKQRFLLINLLRGLLWFALLVILFMLIRKFYPENLEAFIHPFYEQPMLVYGIFLLSEIIFGLIPPEIFILWATKLGSLSTFIWVLLLLFSLSYFSGILGFYFGKSLSTRRNFRYLRRRFLGKYHSMLNRFGMFLILVAALTPLPYSGISMLVGSLNYPAKRYLILAFSRILRFLVYGIIIWEANVLHL